MTFTTEQKLQCLEREIAIRRRVYPGRVQVGRMTPAKALQELDCMREIADDLRQQLAKERLL
jgi:hypothetical protein